MNELPERRTYPTKENEQMSELETDVQVIYFQQLRAQLASDRYRPLYHFSPPGNVMNDPNGLCHWNGNYLLFYQYRPGGPDDVVHWGHTVSSDMVHWRDLPIALYPETEKDCFSGQSMVEKDRVIAIYHGTEAGNAIATSSDPFLLNWEKNPSNPVIPMVPVDSRGGPYRVFDPCIWKQGDGYYSLSGTYQNGERGIDCTAVDHLFRSPDLTTWEYVGPFLESSFFTEPGEDGAVPNFLPLSDDKHLFLFFSHKRASQYFIGRYDEKNHKFEPEVHGRMNYGPLSVGRLHAPSATIDDSGRLLSIFNVKEGISYRGWKDIMSLPRELSLSDGGELLIDPITEIKSLRSKPCFISNIVIPANDELDLEGISGNCIELELEIDPGQSRECGLLLLKSKDGEEKTRVSFMKSDNYNFSKTDTLQIDISESSIRADVLASYPETGPIILNEGENLRLRIFVDKSILEVFANGRQCLTIRAYPDREDSVGVALFARGGDAYLETLKKWDIRSIWV